MQYDKGLPTFKVIHRKLKRIYFKHQIYPGSRMCISEIKKGGCSVSGCVVWYKEHYIVEQYQP